MNRSSRSHFRPTSRRRGITLVEMLVTVAILIIIMTVLVQVFQAATGAVSGAQAIAQLDDQFRRLDGTIRADLAGVTAHFTPPLDPSQGLGYFEYGENEFADAQGEDSDDYIRFTAKAPPGQPFTGRMWVNAWLIPMSNPPTYWNNASVQPVTVTSEYAEIIYFLRNGNLYRRVLLVAPELQSAIAPALSNTGYLANGNILSGFPPSALGGAAVSWQGANDLSARPAGTGPNTNNSLTPAQYAQQTIILNSLGDLTNRENRFAYPRFANDFYNTANGNTTPDGIVDDVNLDNVPDLYPTLYPNVFNTGLINAVNYPNGTPAIVSAVNLMAFPYVFPGAYSMAQQLPTATAGVGWIHSPDPAVVVGSAQPYFYDSQTLNYLQNINHNPLDLGDNLNTPGSANYNQTWWGFPTWRETLSPNWTDPTYQINLSNNLTQPNMLTPLTVPEVTHWQLGNGFAGRVMLPPMTSAVPVSTGWRYNPQLFTDGVPGAAATNLFQSANPPALWTGSWEDDLIMTGVRSFDVKAYDNAYAGYADLGWADDLRLYTPYVKYGATVPASAPGLIGTPTPTNWPPIASGTLFNTLTQTLAHEGRMPPLVNDLVVDAQFGGVAVGTYSANPAYTGNIGDNTVGIVRLRRVWDSWSTEYSRAPGTGVNTTGGPSGAFPLGPPFSPPVYPSYPAPYQAPLRGIQIQIRVVDPTNQRVKSITIVQDFTDKL